MMIGILVNGVEYMKTYGETFRRIREQKGMKMQEVVNDIVSISFLSKFERGQSDISLQSFTELLDRLSVTSDEFFYIHHNYEVAPLEKFFDEAYEAYRNRNVIRLRQLKEHEAASWDKNGLVTSKCNELFLGVYESIVQNQPIDAVDKAELEYLYNYLFKVEVWGYYELRLYSATMLLMTTDMVITLSKTAFEKSARFRKFKKINLTVISILLNTLNYLIGPVNFVQEKMEHEEEFALFVSYIKSMEMPESALFEKLQLMAQEGFYQIKIGHVDKGVQQAKKAIAILTDLEAYGVANNYDNYLRLLLENLSTEQK